MRPRTFLRAHLDVCRENEELHRTVRVLTTEKVHDLALVSSLRDQIARLRADAELLALCVPLEKRPVALEFVRDLHAVDGLEETEEPAP